ncbi:MAG TPA: YCF48-related protein, partial [Planctomycetaceae bacterium]|nr:YCF48-related protein [Planctomycetaceae bacterium]
LRHTRDGGRTWTAIQSPVDVPLRSVCFLSDRVGWIAGGGTTPYARIGYGVVLFTQDGGATWNVFGRESLPQLHHVRFFDLERGVAVGEPNSAAPTGVFTTADGGRTWTPLPGTAGSGFRTADFSSGEPLVGVLAGRNEQIALVGGDRVLPPRGPRSGLRGIRNVRLSGDGTGWMAGDGGLVLRTDNHGVVWQPDSTFAGPLDRLKDFVDFRAVAVRGAHVWIAGAPGSVVWHSPDAGRSWLRQSTGQNLPIHALCFSTDVEGWAVGAVGLLLHTRDGGRTWQAVAGGSRRLAMLAVHGRASQASFPLFVKLSADEGYRSALMLPARRDVGPDGFDGLDLDLRLHEALTEAGAAAGVIDWRFPIELAGLERDREKLVADWERRTERRLSSALLSKLVAHLRTWRPNVVVLDQPGDDDALTSLLNEAMRAAVEQAGDPTRFIEHRDLAGLEPWTVDKIFVRQPPGSTGHAHVTGHEYLPRLGATVAAAATAARSKLEPLPERRDLREAWRLAFDRAAGGTDVPAIRDFFAGISLPPGGEARRPVEFVDDDPEARRRAELQRNLDAYVEQFTGDPRHAGNLIANLRPLTQGLSDREAALSLARVAAEYRSRSQWDLVEATYVELVSRYPREPAAVEAMRWLFQLWTGLEPAWQRARGSQAARHQLVSHPDATLARIEHALEIAETAPLDRGDTELADGGDPLEFRGADGQLQFHRDGQWRDWRTGTAANWHEQALRMAALIRRTSPAVYRSAEVQFPLAALLRERGSLRPAVRTLQGYNRGDSADLWQQAAAGELWALHPVSAPPRPVASCRHTPERPVLDGVLSDVCWQNAKSVGLLASSEAGAGAVEESAFVMFSSDAEYLYVAASVPRDAASPADGPQHAGRTHDADLSRHDRIAIYFDVDRDYATFYALEIDQRGWTTDACWDDRSWNPKWHVAAAGDDQRWQVEAAIPLSELVPAAPQSGAVWALGVVRTVPATRVESWTQPPSARPRPETFGLLRFE